MVFHVFIKLVFEPKNNAAVFLFLLPLQDIFTEKMKHRTTYLSYSLIVIYSLLMIHMSIPHAHHQHEEDEICGQCTHQDCDEHEDAFHCHKIPQHHPSSLQYELQKLIQLFQDLACFDSDIACAANFEPADAPESSFRTYEPPPLLSQGCALTHALRAPPAEV